jgi:Helicase conserved C-terminal domain
MAADLGVGAQVYMLKENEKANMLETELEFVDGKKVIVFVNTKRQCDFVSTWMSNNNYSCTVLHGGKDQNQREASIAGPCLDLAGGPQAPCFGTCLVCGRARLCGFQGWVLSGSMFPVWQPLSHCWKRFLRIAGKEGPNVLLFVPNRTNVSYARRLP